MLVLDEFQLITRYFKKPAQHAVLGIGDDCALLACPPQQMLAISSDMLVAGQHFFENTNPENLGHKALAVNLSDLAAIGATPWAFTLALALPQISTDWLAEFSQGLFALAQKYDCELIGGDTTRGPLTISITIFGLLTQPEYALRRDHAQIGDDIWISGELGDARLALAIFRNEFPWPAEKKEEFQTLRLRLERPEPRVHLAQNLLGLAHAAIDISDGLLADLQHILTASHCGAEVFFSQLPCSQSLKNMDEACRQQCLLAGGDDYELCFTAAPATREKLSNLSQKLQLNLTRIGKIVAGKDIRVLNALGQNMPIRDTGFKHFV